MAEVKPLVMEVGDETFVITQNNDQDEVNTNEIQTSSTDEGSTAEDELEDLQVSFDIDFECHLCEKKFSNSLHLRSHLENDHDPSGAAPKRSLCTTCGTLVSPDDLETHTCHTKESTSFYCLTCKAEFTDRVSLDIHRKSHAVSAVTQTSKQKPVLCTICAKSVSPSDLKAHMLEHHKPKKTYHCLTCKADFKDKVSLKVHRLSHSAEKVIPPEFVNIPIRKPPNTVQQQNTKDVKIVYNGFCKICKLYFSNVETFRAHMRIHGNTAEQASSNSLTAQSSIAMSAGNTSNLECGYCQQKFDNISETRIHLDTGCSFCPVILIKRPSMEMFASLRSSSVQQIFSVVLREKPVVIKQVEKYRGNVVQESPSGPNSEKSSVFAIYECRSQDNSVGIQPNVFANVSTGHQTNSTTGTQTNVFVAARTGNQVKTTTGIQPTVYANVSRGHQANSTTGMQSSGFAHARTESQINSTIGTQTNVFVTARLGNQVKTTTGIQPTVYANISRGHQANSTAGKQSSRVANVGMENQANSTIAIKTNMFVGSRTGNQVTTGIQPTVFANVSTGNQANSTTGIKTILVKGNPTLGTIGMQPTLFAISTKTAPANSQIFLQPSLSANVGSENNSGIQPRSVAFSLSRNEANNSLNVIGGIQPRSAAFSSREKQANNSSGIQPSVFANISTQNQANASPGAELTPPPPPLFSANRNISPGAEAPPSSFPTIRKMIKTKTELSSFANSSDGNIAQHPTSVSSSGSEAYSSTISQPSVPSAASHGNNGNSGTAYKTRFKCGYCGLLFKSTRSIRQHQKDKHAVDQLKMACQKDVEAGPSRLTETTPFTVAGALSFNSQAHKRKKNSTFEKTRSDLVTDEPAVVIKTEPDTENLEFQERSVPEMNTCDICQHTFCSVYNLRRHMKLVHFGKKSLGNKSMGPSHAFPSIRSVFDRDDGYQKPDPQFSPIIQCGDCGKIFSHKRILSDHERSRCKGRTHQCGDCGKMFAQRKGLRQHKWYHCKGKMVTGEVIQCDYCGKSFTDKSYLRKHHLYNQCQVKIKTGENVEQIIQCDLCGKTFSKARGLKKHKKYHCKGEIAAAKTSRNETKSQSLSPIIQCDGCKQTFTLKSSLQRHKVWSRCRSRWSEEETSEKSNVQEPDISQTIKCDDCGRTFTLKDSLRKHRLFHCKVKKAGDENDDNCHEQNIKCDDCGRAFTLFTSLRNHQLFHCKGKKTTDENDDNCHDQNIECEDCGRTFTLKKSLRKHQLFSCKGKKPTDENDDNCHDKNIECDDCGRTFTLKKSLRKHQLFSCKGKKTTDKDDDSCHQQNIKCNDCGKTFTLKKSLRKHQSFNCKGKKTADENDDNYHEQNFKCNDCGRTFTLKKSLRKHQLFHCKGEQTTDDNDDNCTCQKCGKVLLHRESLRKHVRYRCKGHLISKPVRIEKTNSCGICHKNFLHKDSLRKHKLYHCKGKAAQSNLPAKRFECGVCDKAYDSRDSLVRHQNFSCMTKLHESRKYVCDCGSSYFSKEVFMRHKKYFCKLKSPAKGNKVPATEKESTKESEYFCDVCGKVYRHLDSVSRHKKTNCSGRAKCDACGKSCANVVSLRKHKKFFCGKGQAGKYPCSYCERVFSNSFNKRRHEKNLHLINNQAKISQIRTQGLKLQSTKPKIGYGPQSRKSEIVCTKSRKITSSSSIGQPLVALDRFLCHLCEESFVTLEMLRRHKEQDHGVSQKKEGRNTPVKQKSFSPHSSPDKSEISDILDSPKKLVVQLTNIDDDPMKASPGSFKSTEGLCFVCGYDFHRQCKLKIHLQTCLQENGKSDKKPVEAPVAKVQSPVEAEGTARFICNLCGNVYFENSTMLKHRKRCEWYQNMSVSAGGEAVERSVCDICGNGYYSKSALTRHKMHCVLPKPSSIKKVVPKLPHLKSGIKKMFNSIKCDLCGNSYTLKHSMVRHRRKCAALHAKKKKKLQTKQKSKPMTSLQPNRLNKCKYCRRFFHPRSLSRHIKNVHGIKMNNTLLGKTTGKSPASVPKSRLAVSSGNMFPCGLCDKAFVHKFNIYKHQRIRHPTEYKKQLKLKAKSALKAQKDKTSVSSSKLNASFKTSDQNTFTCDICGKVFSNSSNARRHEKNFHSRQEKRKQIQKTPMKKECTTKSSTENKSNLQTSQRRKMDIKMFENYPIVAKKARSDISQNEPTCDICGTVFVHKGSIKKHLKTFHPEEFNKRFSLQTQVSDSKTDNIKVGNCSVGDEQEKEETKTRSSPDSPVDTNAVVNQEQESKEAEEHVKESGADTKEDVQDHSVDKDSLTGELKDTSYPMEVDGAHQERDNKESRVDAIDNSTQSNAGGNDGIGGQEGSIHPVEVEAPPNNAHSPSEKDEDMSEKEDDSGKSKLIPSQDGTEDITDHSDEKTKKDATIHQDAEGNPSLNEVDSSVYEEIIPRNDERSQPKVGDSPQQDDEDNSQCDEEISQHNEENLQHDEASSQHEDFQLDGDGPQQDDKENSQFDNDRSQHDDNPKDNEASSQQDEEDSPQHVENSQQDEEDCPQQDEKDSPRQDEENSPQRVENSQQDEEDCPQQDEEDCSQYDEENSPQHDEENSPQHVENSQQDEDNSQHDEEDRFHHNENAQLGKDTPQHDEEDNSQQDDGENCQHDEDRSHHNENAQLGKDTSHHDEEDNSQQDDGENCQHDESSSQHDESRSQHDEAISQQDEEKSQHDKNIQNDEASSQQDEEENSQNEDENAQHDEDSSQHENLQHGEVSSQQDEVNSQQDEANSQPDEASSHQDEEDNSQNEDENPQHGEDSSQQDEVNSQQDEANSQPDEANSQHDKEEIPQQQNEEENSQHHKDNPQNVEENSEQEGPSHQ